ncbi:TPA: hypothetical protein HA246_00460 [Candidatus Woesearchaeota archaeon]|nr:hypothetical protein [Candidatus Woesearchaeota archaeon]HIH42097.1 hypothetical protein [Candidatus Woesearchaeota archaeon]
MPEMLVVKNKIKEVVSTIDKTFNIGSDVADALSAKVDALIREGVKRAQGNARRTLMGKDI